MQLSFCVCLHPNAAPWWWTSLDTSRIAFPFRAEEKSVSPKSGRVFWESQKTKRQTATQHCTYAFLVFSKTNKSVVRVRRGRKRDTARHGINSATPNETRETPLLKSSLSTGMSVKQVWVDIIRSFIRINSQWCRMINTYEQPHFPCSLIFSNLFFFARPCAAKARKCQPSFWQQSPPVPVSFSGKQPA